MAPSVTPAKPLTLVGASLSLAVSAPVFKKEDKSVYGRNALQVYVRYFHPGQSIRLRNILAESRIIESCTHCLDEA